MRYRLRSGRRDLLGRRYLSCSNRARAFLGFVPSLNAQVEAVIVLIAVLSVIGTVGHREVGSRCVGPAPPRSTVEG